MVKKSVKRFLKSCRRCDELFRPTGRNHYVCDECQQKARKKNYLILKESQTKKMKALSLLVRIRDERKKRVIKL